MSAPGPAPAAPIAGTTVARFDPSHFVRAAWPYAILIALPALFVLTKAAGGSWPLTHERLRYLALAEHWRAAFLAGHWFPRWLPDINAGHGYPTFVFYQSLLFFIWMPFRVLSGDPVSAMWLTLIAMLAAGSSACYRLAADQGSRVLGLFAGCLFLATPYIFVEWFVRGDLSELLALCLVPWALYFLRRVTQAWADGRPLAASAAGCAAFTAGVFLAHPISGLLFGPSVAVIALALVVDVRGRRIDWPLLGRLALVGLGAVALATPYWQPLISLRKAVHLSDASSGTFDPTLHTVFWKQLFGGAWGYRWSQEGPDDGMSFELGGLQLAVALTGAVVGWSNRFIRGSAIALVLSVVAMTTTCTALWSLPVLSDMQFPWRLLSIVAGLQAALASGWAPKLAAPAISQRKLALLLGIAFVAAGWRPEQFVMRAPMPHARAAVAALVAEARSSRDAFAARNEFLPRTVKADTAPPRGDRPLVELPPGVPSTPTPDSQSHHIAVDVDVKAPVDAVINQVYFPGWKVRAGEHVFSRAELEAALQPDGRIRVHLDPAAGARQRIEARYAGPPGAWIRWAGLLGAVLLYLCLRRGDARRTRPV
jgi:hypothetical protein